MRFETRTAGIGMSQKEGNPSHSTGPADKTYHGARLEQAGACVERRSVHGGLSRRRTHARGNAAPSSTTSTPKARAMALHSRDARDAAGHRSQVKSFLLGGAKPGSAGGPGRSHV